MSTHQTVKSNNLQANLVIVGGGGAAFLGLTLGWLLRPKKPSPEKAATYECGEPTIGPSQVQFDLRFYTVALVVEMQCRGLADSARGAGDQNAGGHAVSFLGERAPGILRRQQTEM